MQMLFCVTFGIASLPRQVSRSLGRESGVARASSLGAPSRSTAPGMGPGVLPTAVRTPMLPGYE